MAKPTVLIVEDDGILAMHLEDLLTRQNYSVLKPVATGEAAIQAVKQYHPSIVLMDIELSGELNGLMAAERIHIDTDTPIVFLTGFSQDPLLQQAKIAAPYGYLVKPVPERELAATLEMALYKHKIDLQVKESEARFRALVEQANDGIFLADQNGKIIEVNPAGLSLLGFSLPELLVLNIQNLFHPNNGKGIPLNVSKTQMETDFLTEQTAIKKDGSRFPVEISGKILKNGHVQTIVRDISERKQLEAQVKENDEKLQTIVNTSLDGFFIVNRDGQILDVNDAYCKMMGYAKDELLKMSINDLEMIEIFQETNPHIQKVFHYGTNQFETQHRCKTGTPIDLEISITYLKSRDCFLAFVRNITNRKQTENQLIKLSERFSIAADSAGIGVWDWDLVNDKMVWDDWMFRLFDIEPGMFDGSFESWETCLHPQDSAHVLKSINQAIQGKSEFSADYRIVHSDGSIHCIKAMGIVIRDENNQPVRMTGVNYDITERTQIEFEKDLALKSLSERENLLSKIFEILPVGLWIADQNGSLIQSNIAGRKIWGAEPLVGPDEFHVFKARFLPSRKEISNEDWALARTIKEKMTIKDELLEIDGFDGVTRTILNYSTPVIDGEGNIENVVIVNLDISELKQIEEALIQSEERYRLLFNEMAEGFALHEMIRDDQGLPVDYRFLEVNPMFETMTGLKKEDIIGKTILEILPKTEPYWIHTYGQVALTGKEIHYENFSESIGKWFHVIAFSPKPGQFATTITDITERKMIENELRESEEKYRTYVNQAPFGVFLADQNGCYQQVNGAASKITGYTIPELLTMQITDILPEHVLENAIQHFETLKNSGYAYGEFPFLNKNQESRWLTVTGIKLSETQLLGFVEDITERKQSEIKLQEQLAELRRWHAATLGRENRIIDLKKEVNQLLITNGLTPRYPSVYEEIHE